MRLRYCDHGWKKNFGDYRAKNPEGPNGRGNLPGEVGRLSGRECIQLLEFDRRGVYRQQRDRKKKSL